MNREAWLSMLARKMRPIFKKAKVEFPKRFAVSCGFPSRRAISKEPFYGQCWHWTSSANGTIEIFITPLLDDSLEISVVLLHEMIHASVDNIHGHGRPFIEAAKAIGMIPPYTRCMEGDDLSSELRLIVNSLPPYPHARIIL